MEKGSNFTLFHTVFYAICIFKSFNSFPNDKIYPSKLKEFAAVNFKFDENGRKFSKWEENTVGKGEIARYEQFLLFPQCFQKTCYETGREVSKWVENTVGKGENACNEQFLLLPQCF